VTRRSLVALVAAASAALVLAGVAAALLAGGDDDREPPAELRPAALETCRRLGDDAARECLARRFQRLVSGRDDPRQAVQKIAEVARRTGGTLLSDCHGLMHTVGRTYAKEAGVTLATLMDYLPQGNDPSCTAGFAHGLVTGVAPQLDASQPRESAAVCADAGTRFQRYSCIHGFGHAFMRLYSDQLRPALGLCRALGPASAADCAQGAYHDYWFAVAGADDATLPGEATTDPRRLCGSQPRGFVRPCWYRAFVDNRPEGFELSTPEDLDGLCAELGGIQRAGCITAAAVIGPADPAVQMQMCAALPDPADAANCARGIKVQNLIDASTAEYVSLVDRCVLFDLPARPACYSWLGKALTVITDGEFAETGCPKLRGSAARRQCLKGAGHADEALVTFS
jgi:hypothetical protein